MSEEYVIINNKALKEIEGLGIQIKSISLATEIGKAFDKGGEESERSFFDSTWFRKSKEKYISGLKFEI